MNSTGLSFSFLALLFLVLTPAGAEDFAKISQRDAWLRHPVYGDASFDNFTRGTANPVLRGEAPLEWPVNGFLFNDPLGSRWYLFVGHYPEGYAMKSEAPFQCTVLRSEDHGKNWQDLGPIFPPEAHYFDGESSPTLHAPDVSLWYHKGRYHLAYDWATESSAWGNAHTPGPDANNGSGYAWAERPEGPYHRTAQPIADTRSMETLLGKYRRLYATTLIRREKDWLALILTDSGPNFGWGYLGLRADTPEGPYSSPVMLLNPEKLGYHPPLMEFHPSFVHGGYIYAPATSVARNRNFQMIWRVPQEEALNPEAWHIFQHGSVWHAEPVEFEAHGIWGQAFSGFVDGDGLFNVMFPSRDKAGMGTINLATRPWKLPYRERGFVTSGHEGASLVKLRRAGAFTMLQAEVEVQGRAAVLWNAQGPLGPDVPRADARLHPLMLSNCTALELTGDQWVLAAFDLAGEREELATGPLDAGISRTLEVKEDTIQIDGEEVYTGDLHQGAGTLGLWVAAHSHLEVTCFEMTGAREPAYVRYLYTEALLGAAQNLDQWSIVEDRRFRYGAGAISSSDSCTAKWNFEGSAIRIIAPKGPGYGQASVYLDGVLQEIVDFHAAEVQYSSVVLELSNLDPGFHALVLQPDEGNIPVDVLEVALD